MPSDRTQVRRPQTVQPADAEPAPPNVPGPSPLLLQADGFAAVAREEHENCMRGEDAETVLERRRNSSGQ